MISTSKPSTISLSRISVVVELYQSPGNPMEKQGNPIDWIEGDFRHEK